MSLRFLSLFAGIGGLDLGLERAGMTCVGQCEIDPYCRKLLKQDRPGVWQHDDIRTLTSDLARTHCGRIDAICGGFPCQDISNAGLRAGIKGARSGLWSEYARLVRELRPLYVIVENVAALLVPEDDGGGAPIGRVLGDLASCGFDAEWECLPAGVFRAHHLRDRVFIVASRSNPVSLRPQGKWPPTQESWSGEQFERLVQAELRVSIPSGRSGGISHGVPHRKHRLKALGNAVVPQVAEYVGRRIIESLTHPLQEHP